MDKKDQGSEPKRVLLVEDEEYLRDVYRDLLTDAGFTVDEAKDGQEALDALKKGGYDLILLDIMLPKYDGIQILTRMKEVPPDVPNGPVIILSNLEQEQVIAEGIRLGAASYIIKSDINPDDILTEIRKILPN